MLRSMIENRGKSVYAVAKESGIPYTTLNELVNGKKQISECSMKTISALSAYFNMSLDSLYAKLLEPESKVVVNQTWLLKKRKKYKFPVVKESPYYDASRVHPLKQKLIFELGNMLCQDPRIHHSVLFGGSTTIRCNKKSDVDIAICLKKEEVNAKNKNEISEKVQQMCNWNADIVWCDKVEPESKLAKTLERGVVIK